MLYNEGSKFSFRKKTSITSPKENFTDNNVVTSLATQLQLHWQLCCHFTAFMLHFATKSQKLHILFVVFVYENNNNLANG